MLVDYTGDTNASGDFVWIGFKEKTQRFRSEILHLPPQDIYRPGVVPQIEDVHECYRNNGLPCSTDILQPFLECHCIFPRDVYTLGHRNNGIRDFDIDMIERPKGPFQSGQMVLVTAYGLEFVDGRVILRTLKEQIPVLKRDRFVDTGDYR